MVLRAERMCGFQREEHRALLIPSFELEVCQSCDNSGNRDSTMRQPRHDQSYVSADEQQRHAQWVNDSLCKSEHMFGQAITHREHIHMRPLVAESSHFRYTSQEARTGSSSSIWRILRLQQRCLVECNDHDPWQQGMDCDPEHIEASIGAYMLWRTQVS